MVLEAAISHWLAVFGAPGIIVVAKDMRFVGEVGQEFRTARNIALQTVIPRNPQSMGPRGVDADISERSLIILLGIRQIS